MRILSKESFEEIVRKYSSENDLCGNIVFRNAERRREFYRKLGGCILLGGDPVYIRNGCVISFRNRSRIHLTISANRPKTMYDDILVDETIDDMELMYHLDRAEYLHEEYYIKVPDLGDIETSYDIIEYLGGSV